MSNAVDAVYLTDLVENLEHKLDKAHKREAVLVAALTEARQELSELANMLSREDSFPAIDQALADKEG